MGTDDPIVGEEAGRLEHGLDLSRFTAAGVLGKGMPGLEWLFGIAMAWFPELHERRLGDDAHVAKHGPPIVRAAGRFV